MEIYMYWLIGALLLVLIEILTAGFAVICFAIGAIFAALAAFCGGSLIVQLVAMIVFTAISFVLVRPFAIKYLNPKNQAAMNADAIIGRTGHVTETIDSAASTGRVAVDGDEWKAISANNTTIAKGSVVRITHRESLVVTVEEVKE